MGKRSEFVRRRNDAYDTWDPRAVRPLANWLGGGSPLRRIRYTEPCAGDGTLIANLAAHGFQCVDAWDIAPRRGSVHKRDASQIVSSVILPPTDMFITNPPWSRELLHPIIERLSRWLPTWMLLDADYAHLIKAAPYMAYCRYILSIGRLKWIRGSRDDGKDNCAWYLFDQSRPYSSSLPVFVSKGAAQPRAP